MVVIGNGQTFTNDNNIVLVLESHTQNQELNGYRCTVKQSQIQVSKIVYGFLESDNDGHSGDVEVPLPYYENQEFFRDGFHDMCYYIQNNIFNQHYNYDEKKYRLPKPLLLNNQNDFYDLEQLTDDEISFMKELESFDNNNDNTNPFDIDITRMNNLFKLSDYLQMERLFTIIAARQASLMMNMNKKQMIDWLMDSQTQNNNNNGDDNNHNNPKMAPLLYSQTQTSSQDDNNNSNEEEYTINDIIKYHSGLLQHIMPFFSCAAFNTFSSISNDFYQFTNTRNVINPSFDPMAKILTNNNDSTCLSLTTQEMAFYKPFLTLPKSRWSENQNNTYDRLKKHETNDWIGKYGFRFNVLEFSDGQYWLQRIWGTNQNPYYDPISIDLSCHGNASCIISFKFGNFAQKVNVFAQSRNSTNVAMCIRCTGLSSVDDLIGINDIENIKEIHIDEHSLLLIDFKKIYNITDQLIRLEIKQPDSSQFVSAVKNMQFLSKLESLKYLHLERNYLDEFDFDVLEGLADLTRVTINSNKFNYTSHAKCLDFSFLNNIPNLKILSLRNNQIECIDNFMAIQTHSNLETVQLHYNRISSLNLNAFKGTKIQDINLHGNKLGSFSDDNDLDKVILRENKRSTLGLSINPFEGINMQPTDLWGNELSSFSDHDNTHQLKSCLDFHSFDKMKQLRRLDIAQNQFDCIENFESIQQHTQLERLNLSSNHLSSSILDFTQFDKSKPSMNSLQHLYFANMNLKYTKKYNNCFDLKFLKFTPNVYWLDLSHNQIECIELSMLQKSILPWRKDSKLRRLNLNNNSLVKFNFDDLINTNIKWIDLRDNNLSPGSVKNFDNNTLSKIDPSGDRHVEIYIREGNDEKFASMYVSDKVRVKIM